MTLQIALLGGEGIGPEVVEATAEVLEHVLGDVDFVRPIHGKPALDAHGDALPEASKQVCRDADAVIFGATQKHCHPVLRFLRWGLVTHANLRPARNRPRLDSPLKNDQAVDLLVVRENLEGEYPGREGELSEFTRRWPELRDNFDREVPREGRFTVRVTTEEGTRRVVATAIDKAKKRRRRATARQTPLVTVVTKANVLRYTDGWFREIAFEMLEEAGMEYEHFFVDDAARRLVEHPWTFDVIVCPNLFGDILSDITAELVGGMGMAPSGCVGVENAYFESVHGSAPDIAGQGVANPLATVLSARMMLDHLGLEDLSDRIDHAVDDLLADGSVLTPDLGGSASTDQVTRALIDRLDD
ncbi:MAG: isocitrate/isopropylmalate family dehydrogenase [Acidobacteriota bacterium]